MNACSHSGCIDIGFNILNSINQDKLDSKIIASMIDCLARKNELSQAYQLFCKHSKLFENEIQDTIVIYTQLLSGCRTYNNVEMGEKLFYQIESLIKKEKNGYKVYNNDAATFHVLLANLYATNGLQNKCKDIRNQLKEKGIKKIAGMSWIEIDGITHKFIANDQSHPNYNQIERKKQQLIEKLNSMGYKFEESVITRQLNEYENVETHLCGHSEKLALLYGLISTTKNTTLTVAKNLRVCKDCHNVCKIISKLEKRVIKLRDAKRWHIFKDGKCSCNDFF